MTPQIVISADSCILEPVVRGITYEPHQKENHMTNINRGIIAALVLGILVAGLSGCKKEGPMERTGKEIDKAADKAGDKIEKAGENMKDAVKDLKK
jgi:hypothetical protein